MLRCPATTDGQRVLAPRQLGRELGKAVIPIEKAKVGVDGFHKDDNRVTLVEAHVGKAKAAQRNKVLAGDEDDHAEECACQAADARVQ